MKRNKLLQSDCSIRQLSLMLVFFCVLLLCSCSRTSDTGETENLSFLYAEPETIGNIEIVEEESENDLTETYLDLICYLNSCNREDLNIVYDSEGYLSFLGNRFTERTVNTSQDVMACLQEITLLCGLEGLEFSFEREVTSPVTGLKYYTLRQISGFQTDTAPIEYFNKGIKIFVDSEGITRGLLCDVERRAADSIREDFLVGRADAEEFILNQLPENSRVFSKYSRLVYIEDSYSVSQVGNSELIPVWLVYTDVPDGNNPYTVYLVYAYSTDSNASYTLVDSFPSGSLNSGSSFGNSKNDLFFSEKTYAGNFSYEIDLCHYTETGEIDTTEHKTVSVPVMQDTKTGLYYLADKDTGLTVTNYFDFSYNGEINPVVSENPYDASSWHFLNDFLSADGQSCFFDSAFILYVYSKFSEVLSVRNQYLNYDTTDGTVSPVLLNLYYFNGSYPSGISDFSTQLSSLGLVSGWNSFAVSPVCDSVIDFESLAAVYFNGLCTSISARQYCNENGAVLKGTAEAITEQFSWLSGQKGKDNRWKLFSTDEQKRKNFADPVQWENSRYIGGAFYVSPVSGSLCSVSDCGGVTVNSGAVNYLAYLFSESEDKTAAVLSAEDNLTLWIEQIFCSGFQYDFELLDAGLRFAANLNKNLSGEQKSYIAETLKKLGFQGEKEDLTALISKEKNRTFSLNVTAENSPGVRLAAFLNDTVFLGMTDEEGNLTYCSPEICGEVSIKILQNGKIIGNAVPEPADGNSYYSVSVSYCTLKAGDTFQQEDTSLLSASLLKLPLGSALTDQTESVPLKDGEDHLVLTEIGIYCILTKTEVQADYYLYIVCTE